MYIRYVLLMDLNQSRDLYVIRQNKKSNNVKLVIFIVIYAALVVFSLAWYNALTSIDCDITHTLPSNPVRVGSSQDVSHSCSDELNFHWIKFYGINGLIYGASLFIFVANARKKNRN